MAKDKKRSLLVQRLNDDFRKDPLTCGRLLLTAGVDANGMGFVTRAVRAVRRYDLFTRGNDPHGEHIERAAWDRV